MSRTIWLVWELTTREFAIRYKGTLLGALWPVLYSGMFLAVFSFVFTVILRVRWGTAGEQSAVHGSIMIFCGMVPYFFFAEVTGRSPSLILSSANLVKRVRFPIHLNPVVAVNSAFLIALLNCFLLTLFGLAAGEASLWAIIYLPLILVPLYLFNLAVAWIVSSFSVFFRDMTQIVPIFIQVIMFMAPVFYPLQAVPSEFHAIFSANPLTYFVEAFRTGVVGTFDAVQWGKNLAVHGVFAVAAAWIFSRLRPAFADLL